MPADTKNPSKVNTLDEECKADPVFSELVIFLKEHGDTYAYNVFEPRIGHQRLKKYFLRIIELDSHDLPNLRARAEMRRYMNDYKGRDSDLLEPFMEWLDHQDEKVRSYAVVRLRHFNPDQRVIPALTGFIDNHREDDFISAYCFLVAVDYQAAIPILMNVLDEAGSHSTDNVNYAAFTLAEITRDHPSTEPSIRQQLFERVTLRLSEGVYSEDYSLYSDPYLWALFKIAREIIEFDIPRGQEVFAEMFSFMEKHSNALAIDWAVRVLLDNESIAAEPDPEGKYDLSFLEERGWEVLGPHQDTVVTMLQEKLPEHNENKMAIVMGFASRSGFNSGKNGDSD